MSSEKADIEFKSKLNTGSPPICPRCNKLMRVLNTQTAKPAKPEAYCEDCHHSVALF